MPIGLGAVGEGQGMNVVAIAVSKGIGAKL